MNVLKLKSSHPESIKEMIESDLDKSRIEDNVIASDAPLLEEICQEIQQIISQEP